MGKKALLLVCIFLASSLTGLIENYDTQILDVKNDSQNVGSTTGFHSSSPLSIEQSREANFVTSQVAYLWFTTTGLTDETYINVSSNDTNWNNYYLYGELSAYTAHDTCLLNAQFSVWSGANFLCSNPSLNSQILFSISFLNVDGTNKLQDNLTLNITIGHLSENGGPSPPTNTIYNYSDGDLNRDSQQYDALQIQLEETSNPTLADGYFESTNDMDYIGFQSQYIGTHRINITIDNIANIDYMAGLDDCKISDTSGYSFVKDIHSGSSSSSPGAFTAIGNTIYFLANDGTSGIELWKSDGTEAGTVMVKDIRSGYSSSSLSSLTAMGNTLYFNANDGNNGSELWKSDGTEAGTVMVKDINSGIDGSSLGELTAVGNTLYFNANDGNNGFELWKSDGTESGTVMVKDIHSGSSSSSPGAFTAIGNTIYFSANDGTNGTELWKSDGTEAGTVMVKDIRSGYSSSSPYYLTAIGNTLYFNANDGNNGFELWKSDGTESGTVMVKDINSGSASSSPTSLTAMGNTLYFNAGNGSNGTELWKSDGTANGTVMVKDINSGSSGSSPYYLTAMGNTLYFSAYDGTNGSELWKSDGTESGTVMVKDINSGGSSSPSSLTAMGNTLYFNAYDGINGYELWKSDGTEAGTVMVKDINRGDSSYPGAFTATGNTLYFSAFDGINGYELHSVTSTNIQSEMTFIDCLIISESPSIGFNLANSGSGFSPLPWTTSVRYTAVHPIEDPQHGDSNELNQFPPLIGANSSLSGNFHSQYDQDIYAIPILHGTMQHIEIHTSSASYLTILSGPSHCTFDGEEYDYQNNSQSNLELEGYTNLISCDTRYFADELKFKISHQSSSVPLVVSAYSINTYTTSIVNLAESYTDDGILDVPARGDSTVVNRTATVVGSFLHWSDQTDGYQIVLEQNQSVSVDLRSNCATFETSQKDSYHEILELTYAPGIGVSPDEILPDGRGLYDISVKRLAVNGVHDSEIKDSCEYTIRTTPLEYSEQHFSYGIIYDGRVHSSTAIHIDNFSDYLPSYVNSSQYELTLPFDLLPTLNGLIQANQESGAPVFLQLLGTHQRDAEMDNTLVGQNIDFGNERVQWSALKITGLDGSELTTSLTVTSINHLTKENLELFSIANGALGTSSDEGWDDHDIWTFNDSSSATFASVQLKSFSNTLEASIGLGNGISHLVCFNSDPPNLRVQHQKGSGGYSLEIRKGYSACPVVSLQTPYVVTQGSSFTATYNSNELNNLSLRVYDKNLQLVYSSLSQIIEGSSYPITLPTSIGEGTYQVLLQGTDSVVYDENTLIVVNHSTNIVQKTTSVLDANEEPQISIQAFMPHSGEPVEWTFTNVSIQTMDNTGALIEQPLENDFSGEGAKVLTIENLPIVMPGAKLSVQGELHTDKGMTTHILTWRKVYHSPLISCEELINPNYQLPENDILCLISLQGKTHGTSYTQPLTKYQVQGSLEVYDESFTIVETIDFQNELFEPTPMRIDSLKLGEGIYYVKLNLSEDSNIYLEEVVSQFEIGGFESTSEEQEVLGFFDLNLISVRDTALAGDDLLIGWKTTGEEASYFLIEVYANSTIKQSFSLLNDGADNGIFQIELPDDTNSYLKHSILVTAISKYGLVSTDIAEIDGKSQHFLLDVNLNPERPTIGSQVDVQLILSSDGDWIKWNWILRSSCNSESSILIEGEGFSSDNEANFNFDLPMSQYTESPCLFLEVETEDGTILNRAIIINPIPFRTIQLEMDTTMVIKEMYDVEWKLDGKFLNSLDNIERIQFSVYSMNSDLYHTEVYHESSNQGQFSTRIPSTLNPGTHLVQIEFMFVDGGTYEHTQLVTVLSEPSGLNAFGLNIPPLALGLDTVLVALLMINAAFMHQRLRTKKRKETEESSDSDLDDYMSDFGVIEDKGHDFEKDVTSEEFYEELQDELGESKYPMYQEYPSNSGNRWVQHSADSEWELLADD